METSTLAKRIIALRKLLGISQSELGAHVGTSPMGVSRWERSQGEPSSRMLLRLGLLSKDNPKMCWSFWNDAGLSARDVSQVLPIAAERLRPTIPILRFVKAGPGGKTRRGKNKENLVVIPFLQVVVSAGKDRGSLGHDLRHAHFDQVIAAPRLWCPNPEHTVAMRVKGDSMEPTLFDGYIIVVDQVQTQKSKLNKQIVVAHHDKIGLVVSRFWQFKDSSALVSDNRLHEPAPWSAAWSIVGRVLWWIGEAGAPTE